eukprot:TRINITY_DN11481_c1_g1_i1.p1 TRINITY_DN11481_c1_g1~~TRINITY_DN11481_c1_g1_i1.p1  ORF type:complete len:452 (-),score=122.17 TRINITY_DN11481_c1_g1_i1:76-1392(-)
MAKEEERLLKAMSRKPGAPTGVRTARHSVAVAPGPGSGLHGYSAPRYPASGTASPSASSTVHHPASPPVNTSEPGTPVKTASFSSPSSPLNPNVVSPPSRSIDSIKGDLQKKAVTNEQPIRSNSRMQNTHHNEKVDELVMKKRTLQGTIASTKRDIEEVRAEIAKLKSKEADLIALLERREQGLHQLVAQIEELEVSSEKDRQAADLKRQEQERLARLNHEAELRRREEEEERKRQLHQQQVQMQHQNVVNSTYQPELPSPASPVRGAFVSDSEDAEARRIAEEEERLLRAMQRQKGGARTSYVRTTPVHVPSAARTDSQQEQQQRMEEQRRREEQKRKEEESQLLQQYASQSGVSHTFRSPPIYDYDAQITFTADFTQWREVPVASEIDKDFTYSITLPVPPGVHFYRFRAGGKWEVNKAQPTGVAPTGDLMNKVEV